MNAGTGVERAAIEYLVNALWQLPVLAAGAWLLVQGFRPGVLAQHRVWLAVLGLAVVLPGLGMGRDGASAAPAALGAGAGMARGTDVGDGIAARGLAREDGAGAAARGAGGATGSGVAGREAAVLAELVRVRQVRLTARATHLLVGLYGATLAFGLLRIVRAWMAARGLVRRSREAELTEWGPQLWRRSGGERLLGRGGLPELRESAEVTSPVVVGAWAPVLLLPEGIGRYTQEEVRAVLCHELAHVARRDYLTNLACQVAGVPLGWHPVLHAVQRQIRRTREMVCDRMAARAMESELVYAQCLLRLAREMFGAGRVADAGVGLFSSNVLEERVMRLIEQKEMRVRTKGFRMAWGVAAMASALTLAAMVHVTPTWAAMEPMAVVQADSGVSAGAMPVPPAPPVAPAKRVAGSKPAPRPRPTPAAAPVQAQAPAPLPAPPVPPAPAAAAPAHGDEQVSIVDGEQRALTPEEQRALDREMAEMQRSIKEATAHLPGSEFDRQMRDLDRKMAEATAKFDSAEFKQQVADAERRAAEATAKVNSPEFRARIEEAERKAASAQTLTNSPEFKQRVADAARQAAKAEAMVNSPEFQQRLQKAQEQMQRAAQELEDAARRMQAARPEGPGAVK